MEFDLEQKEDNDDEIERISNTRDIYFFLLFSISLIRDRQEIYHHGRFHLFSKRA